MGSTSRVQYFVINGGVVFSNLIFLRGSGFKVSFNMVIILIFQVGFTGSTAAKFCLALLSLKHSTQRMSVGKSLAKFHDKDKNVETIL